MKLRQELPAGEPTIPVEMAEAAMAQQSCRCEILKPGEMIVQDKTPMPGKPLLLAGVLIGILMFSGILTGVLILAGIQTGVLMLAGTLESEEIDISEGTHTPISDRAQTVSRRTQIGLGKRRRRRGWVVCGEPGEWVAH